MKLALALLFGLLALASESLVSVVLAAIAGWLMGGQQELQQRVRKLERDIALEARAPRPTQTARPATPEAAPTHAQATPFAAQSSNNAATASDATSPQQVPTLDTAARSPVAPGPETSASAALPRLAASVAAPPPLPPRVTDSARQAGASAGAHRPSAQPTSTTADELVSRLMGWLFGGNLPVKLGVLVLFAGVAAALRYAAQQGLFNLPIGWRFAGIATAALAALVFGLSQRNRRPAFSLSLQGGAIGVLLMCVFGAYRLYALLTPGTALGLVIALVALGAVLAVWQNAVALAVLGFLGGYLGPVLINTGSGDHIALFTYYAALNAAVFGVAWWRHWHPLNLMGFLFTFGIGSLWALRSYSGEDYASSQFFLLLFWGFYLGIVLLGALRRGLAASDGVQASLTFALPLWAFSLQAGLLEGDRSALASAALLAAALYAALAALLLRGARAQLQGKSFAWVAAGFVTVAVPLAFSAEQTAAVWALQGVGAMWLGLRQGQTLTRAFGWLLQLAAACAFLLSFGEAFDEGVLDERSVILGMRFSLGLLALAGFIASLVHERHRRTELESWLLYGLGAVWLGVLWLHFGVWPPFELQHFETLLGLAVLIAVGAVLLRGLLGWSRLGWMSVLPLIALPALAVTVLVEHDSPALDGRGVLLWALAFAAGLFTLQRLREPPAHLTGAAHLAVLATLALVLGSDFSLRAQRGELGDAWNYSLAMLPLALLAWGLWQRPERFAWPLADRFQRYARFWHGSAALALGAGWVGGLYSSGDAQPLPYIPLLNPLELLQWALLLIAWRALQRETRSDLLPLRAGLAAGALLLLTVATLRSLHHHADLPWSPALFDSALTQGALSVLWALAGVVAWVRGSRSGNWYVWLGGAALMGVVLLKLVLVDRAYLGNLAGIGAVLTVGLLLVIVGYLAPSPPRRAESAAP
jgi:uncharacterized membrane protein